MCNQTERFKKCNMTHKLKLQKNIVNTMFSGFHGKYNSKKLSGFKDLKNIIYVGD